jgi:hypothetical protein
MTSITASRRAREGSPETLAAALDLDAKIERLLREALA